MVTQRAIYALGLLSYWVTVHDYINGLNAVDRFQDIQAQVSNNQQGYILVMAHEECL
jgi:hypothetical protein